MRPRRAARGFTLVEVLVVMTIAGILASIAIPSYRAYAMRAHRADARVAMMQVAQWLERQYATTNSFCPGGGSTCPGYELPAAMRRIPATGRQTYELSLRQLDADSYRIAAAPSAGGPMARDRCGTLTLDNAGRRGQQGGTEADCWRR